MERKLSNKSKENIIYLSENDARALGIVEGDTQSVFVDGRRVAIQFVDEHEIFDATPNEKRILNNALVLRKRELIEKLGDEEVVSRSNYLVPYGTLHDDYPDFDSFQVSKRGTGFFGSIKSFFGKKHKPENAPAKDVLFKSKYSNRTDIFTNEEIEIIQEVISRAQGSNYRMYQNEYVAPKKRKTSKKSKKSSSKKRIANAKGHELSTLNKKKAKRNLDTGNITSPKKKQARRAARRKSKR